MEKGGQKNPECQKGLPNLRGYKKEIKEQERKSEKTKKRDRCFEDAR